MNPSRFTSAAILCLVLLAGAPATQASPIAYDGFAYVPGGSALNTYAPGGFGWSNAWSGTPTVTASGFTYDDPVDLFRHLQVQGTAISCQTGVNVRTLSIGTPLGNATRTVWFSMIARQTSATVAGTWGGVTLPCTGPNSSLFFGKPYGKSHWGLDAGSLASHLESATLSTQQAFLVMRVDFKAGLDDVYLWINPRLDQAPNPALADVQAPAYGDFQGITQVSLASNTACLFDELRIGDSFQDVAPFYLLWSGNKHLRKGNAAIVRDGLGQLEVSNIGSSGLDGFDMDTGELAYGGLSLAFGSNTSMSTGYHLEVSGRGDVADSADVWLGTATVRDIGGGTGQLDFAIRPEIATSFEARAYLGETLVYSQSGHSGQGITFQPLVAPQGKDPVIEGAGNPIGGLDVTLVKKTLGDCRRLALLLTDESSLDFGTTVVSGDRIELRVPVPLTLLAVQRILSVRVENTSQLVINAEDNIVGDRSISSLGDAAFAYMDSGGADQRAAIKVKSGSGGSYGVKEKERPGSGTSGVTSDLEARGPDQPGKEERFAAKGKLDGTPDQPLGEVWWANVGGTQTLNADFAALGASDAAVEIYSGGVLVSSSVVSGAGVVATVDDPATLVKVKRLSYAPFDFQLSSAVHLTPSGGSQVLGDRIRVGPSPALAALGTSMTAATEDVDELDIVMTGIDSFYVILDPLPPTTGVPPAGSGPALGLAIERVHPVPAAGGFTVALALPSSAPARVEVLDLQGRRVRSVMLPSAAPGRRVIELDRDRRLAAGVYLLRIEQDGRAVTGRVVVLR